MLSFTYYIIYYTDRPQLRHAGYAYRMKINKANNNINLLLCHAINSYRLSVNYRGGLKLVEPLSRE